MDDEPFVLLEQRTKWHQILDLLYEIYKSLTWLEGTKRGCTDVALEVLFELITDEYPVTTA